MGFTSAQTSQPSETQSMLPLEIQYNNCSNSLLQSLRCIIDNNLLIIISLKPNFQVINNANNTCRHVSHSMLKV